MGIELGDIGPKFGFNANDNGFLRLDHAKVPLFNMLSKHAQVTPDGFYIKPRYEKLGYGTMMIARANIAEMSYSYLSKATTIAIRYSCVRRQGYVGNSKGETKILEYRTQQEKLFPQLAASFALKFTSDSMKEMRSSQGEEGQIFHALSAGLKAYSTKISGIQLVQ
jgi:acyl-CoA oxidase